MHPTTPHLIRARRPARSLRLSISLLLLHSIFAATASALPILTGSVDLSVSTGLETEGPFSNNDNRSGAIASGSGLLRAEIGENELYGSVALAYMFSNEDSAITSTLSINTAQSYSRAGGSYGFTYGIGEFNFTVTEDVHYSIADTFRGGVQGGDSAESVSYLYSPEGGGLTLYENIDESSALAFSFSSSDGLFNGSSTGTLLAGHDYSLRVSQFLGSDVFDDSVAGIANGAGTWTATFTRLGGTPPPDDPPGHHVPDGGATAPLLGLALLGLVVARRRSHAAATR